MGHNTVELWVEYREFGDGSMYYLAMLRRPGNGTEVLHGDGKLYGNEPWRFALKNEAERAIELYKQHLAAKTLTRRVISNWHEFSP